MNKSVFEIKI